MESNAIAIPIGDDILTVLNKNRILDELRKAAIRSLGLSSCNVKCIAYEIGKGKYISKG